MSSIDLHDPETNQFRVGAVRFPDGPDFIRETESVPIEGTPASLAFTARSPVIRNRLDLEEFPTEVNEKRWPDYCDA
jgi:hypothetical protein